MYLIKNAAEYLINTAERLPDKTAFADDGRSFTFGELLGFSRRVGQRVYSVSGGVRERIAVLVDRSAVSLLGCIGVLFSGSCYVPIDDKMPSDRMEEILSQINPAAVLYSEKDAKVAEKLCERYKTIIIEDAMNSEYDPSLEEKIFASVLDIDPAYMIFTSGSTGKPKGILISHRSLIDFTEWMAEVSGVAENDVLGNQAPFYFDLSVKDIYQTLRNGCTTHIIAKKFFMFPTLLIDFLNSHKITALIWATS
ncbi:MAG: AMP-binding protein, partial [Eubacteriales bacterium]